MKSYAVFNKIGAWFARRSQKEAAKLIAKNIFISKILLDEDFRNKYPELDKDSTFELAKIVIEAKFFGLLPKPVNKESAFYKKHKEKIEKEINQALTNIRISERYRIHLQLLKYWQQDSLHLFPEDNPYKQQLQNEILLTKKELKEKKKSILNLYKEKRKNFLDEVKLEKLNRSEKIEITSGRVSILIALLSVLFLSTGFIYNQIYLKYFGLELSKYFTISDYLSTSADKIFYSVISIGITSALALLVFPEYIQGEFPKRHPSERVIKVEDFVFRLLPLLTLIATIFAYVTNQVINFYSSLQALVYFTFLNLLAKNIGYFKSPARAYFFISTIIIFVTSVSIGALKDIHHIVHDDLSEIKNYKITFETHLKIKEDNLILLASNSNWFFFYDKATNKTKVIPTKEVISVESTRASDSYLYNFFIEHFQNDKPTDIHPISKLMQ